MYVIIHIEPYTYIYKHGGNQNPLFAAAACYSAYYYLLNAHRKIISINCDTLKICTIAVFMEVTMSRHYITNIVLDGFEQPP